MRAAGTDGAEGSARTRAPNLPGIIRAGLKKEGREASRDAIPRFTSLHPFARGAAFVDRTGAVVAADPGFVSHLGLAPGAELTGAMRERRRAPQSCARSSPAKGPTSRGSRGVDGELVELQRVPSGEGSLL